MQTLRPQDRRQGVSVLHQRQPETGAVQSGESLHCPEKDEPTQIYLEKISSNSLQFKNVGLGCGEVKRL